MDELSLWDTYRPQNSRSSRSRRTAPGASDTNRYIQRVYLNNTNLTKNWVSWADVAGGGNRAGDLGGTTYQAPDPSGAAKNFVKAAGQSLLPQAAHGNVFALH